jgi:hypothetical protein
VAPAGAGGLRSRPRKRSVDRTLRRPSSRPGPGVRVESLLAGTLTRRIEAPDGENPSPATLTARVRELARQGMRPAAIAPSRMYSRTFATSGWSIPGSLTPKRRTGLSNSSGRPGRARPRPSPPGTTSR